MNALKTLLEEAAQIEKEFEMIIPETAPEAWMQERLRHLLDLVHVYKQELRKDGVEV